MIDAAVALWFRALPYQPKVIRARFENAAQLGQAQWTKADATPVIVLAEHLDEDAALRIAAHEAAHLLLGHITKPMPYQRRRPLVDATDYRRQGDADHHRRIEAQAEAKALQLMLDWQIYRLGLILERKNIR